MYEILEFFLYDIFTYLNNFICLAGVVKILKDLFEEDSLIVAPEISHILFIYFDFIFLLYLPILESIMCL